MVEYVTIEELAARYGDCTVEEIMNEIAEDRVDHRVINHILKNGVGSITGENLDKFRLAYNAYKSNKKQVKTQIAEERRVQKEIEFNKNVEKWKEQDRIQNSIYYGIRDAVYKCTGETEEKKRRVQADINDAVFELLKNEVKAEFNHHDCDSVIGKLDAFIRSFNSLDRQCCREMLDAIKAHGYSDIPEFILSFIDSKDINIDFIYWYCKKAKGNYNDNMKSYRVLSALLKKYFTFEEEFRGFNTDNVGNSVIFNALDESVVKIIEGFSQCYED